MLLRRGPCGLRNLLVGALGLTVPALVLAAEGDDNPDAWQPGEPDTSNWTCRLCPAPSGWSGYVDLGAGYVSEESRPFGNARGLEEQGLFPVAGGQLDYRDEGAHYAEFSADHLGLESRWLEFEGGRQGRYDFRLDYRELPHYRRTEDGQTVFSRAGSAHPVLPSNWVRADSTQGMTELDNSLRDFEAGYDRDSLGVGFDLHQQERWTYSLDYHRDTQEGDWVRGGSFLFRSAELPEPVDYETERIDVSVAYRRERWQLQAGYHLSLFTNNNDALVWDNPFTSANGADQGRMALEPDNRFHRIMLSGSWRPLGSWAVAGRLSVGRMEQDEAFLPATINSSFTAPALPRDSLNGEVDTRTANLRITGEPLDHLGARLELAHDERDNNTPRDQYTQVVTDEFITRSRTNEPLSFEENEVELGLDYRFTRELRFAGATAYEEKERRFQDSEKTKTNTHWVEFRTKPLQQLDLSLRQTLEKRRGSQYRPQLSPQQHPRLGRFHIADRDRDATRLRLGYIPKHWLSLGLTSRIAIDDYTNSEVGLTGARDHSHSLDLSLMPTDGTVVNGFISLQSNDADIRGNDNIDGAAWKGEQEDTYWTLGLGYHIDDLPGRFTEGGIDVTYAKGTTGSRMNKVGSTAPPLPELDSELYTVELFAERTLFDSADLRLGYLLERFNEDNFQRDGVDPDTIPTTLTLGADSPDYTAHVIRMALRYRF